MSPSQSLSIPSHTSVAPGNTVLSVSSQSVLLVTKPAGKEHAVIELLGSPKPSPSVSA